MPTFHLYNYQFGKLGSEESPNLFSDKTLSELAEDNFPQRQNIFGDLLKDDYDGKKYIVFANVSGTKEYAHKHLMCPIDGIIILKIANVKKRNITQKTFEVKEEEDFINCMLIIDNREGIQRIAIEQNKSVFKDSQTLANIFQITMNKILRSYGLHVELYHLQNSCDFWKCVNDKNEYPKGFYKLIFKLPHLNLDRLSKKIDKIVTSVRKSYDSNMTIEMAANPDDSLSLSENDEFQRTCIDYMMEDLGGNSITMIPACNKKSRILVGKNSHKTTFISDSVFKQVEEDAAGNTLFMSEALDEIKNNTTIGI